MEKPTHNDTLKHRYKSLQTAEDALGLAQTEHLKQTDRMMEAILTDKYLAKYVLTLNRRKLMRWMRDNEE